MHHHKMGKGEKEFLFRSSDADFVDAFIHLFETTWVEFLRKHQIRFFMSSYEFPFKLNFKKLCKYFGTAFVNLWKRKVLQLPTFGTYVNAHIHFCGFPTFKKLGRLHVNPTTDRILTAWYVDSGKDVC